LSTERSTATAADPDGTWLYRLGGSAALAVAAAYVLIIPLYAHVGAPPSGGEAWLKYAAGKTTVWWAILGLSVLTDLLLVPVAFALYLALRGINRNAMLVATAFVGLFVVVDLAVTWSNYASLITLSGSYATARTDLQREGYVAAANYASAVLSSGLEAVYSILTLSVGILLVGWVMLRGVFSRPTAYLGLATGTLGTVAVAGRMLLGSSSVTVIIASVLTTVWLVLVGYRLFRLGQTARHAPGP
jgi:hypothetical protein